MVYFLKRKSFSNFHAVLASLSPSRASSLIFGQALHGHRRFQTLDHTVGDARHARFS
jgi:hypothetical protein